MPAVEPPERRRLADDPQEVTDAAGEVEGERRRRAEPTYQITSVTKLVKHDASVFAVDRGGLGRAWGNAVHQALEAAQAGGGPEAVRAICRTALLDNDLPIGDDGEPTELAELVELVDRVRASETWQRAARAVSRLIEAPFAFSEGGEGTGAIVEGVIDLLFEEDDGWVIVDYKTDVVDDPAELEPRREQYRSQVDTYARYFQAITGESVKERQLLWLGRGLEAEIW